MNTRMFRGRAGKKRRNRLLIFLFVLLLAAILGFAIYYSVQMRSAASVSAAPAPARATTPAPVVDAAPEEQSAPTPTIATNPVAGMFSSVDAMLLKGRNMLERAGQDASVAQAVMPWCLELDVLCGDISEPMQLLSALKQQDGVWQGSGASITLDSGGKYKFDVDASQSSLSAALEGSVDIQNGLLEYRLSTVPAADGAAKLLMQYEAARAADGYYVQIFNSGKTCAGLTKLYLSSSAIYVGRDAEATAALSSMAGSVPSSWEAFSSDCASSIKIDGETVALNGKTLSKPPEATPDNTAEGNTPQ